MPTHDYILDNASGAAFRTDLNNALAAIVSNNSNSSSPSTTYAYQWWADTSANVLKIRNSSNNAWITLFTLAGGVDVDSASNFNEDVTFTGASANIVFDKSDSALEFADDAKATFGTGADLSIFHDQTNSIIKSDTGQLSLRGNDIRLLNNGASTALIKAFNGGAVELYNDGAKKLETISTGANVTSANDAVLQVTTTGSGSTDDARLEIITGAGTFTIQNDRSVGTSGALTFAGNTSNNLVIDHNSGDVLMGLTASGTTSEGMVFSPGGTSTFFRDSNTLLIMGGGTTQTVIQFRQGTTNIGSIGKTTANVSFNTSSDYRLKENVTVISDGITRLKELIPKRFNWIVDETNTLQDGFLAHEVSSTVPEAITGEKDAVDSDGKIVPQSIDLSKLVPLLTAALKEAVVKIETLETKVAALESA